MNLGHTVPVAAGEHLGLEDGTKDVIVLHGGRMLETHGPAQCGSGFCCIHRPSAHVLNDRPLLWRDDSRPAFMERVCPHGIGHPDPDSLAWLATVQRNPRLVEALEIHSCDGCCFEGRSTRPRVPAGV